MTREEAASRVLDYVYGEMPPDAAREFEVVLRDDAELAREVAELRSVREVMGRLPRPSLPSDVRQAILFAARRRIAARRQERRFVPEWLERFLLSPAFSGAMTVAVALAAGAHIVGRFDAGEDLSAVDRIEREATRPLALEPALGAKEPAVSPAPQEVAPEAAAPEPKRVREVTRKQRAPAAREQPTDVVAVARSRPEPAAPMKVVAPGWGRVTGGADADAGPAAAPRAAPAPSVALDAAPPMAAEARQARSEAAPASDYADPQSTLARARRLAASGRREAALDAYLAAIEGLSGDKLRDALREAADLADALGRTEVARRLRDRLREPAASPPAR